MSVHTKSMWVRVPGTGQMCHTVPAPDVSAPEHSWGTHSFGNVVPCAALCREQVLLYRRGLLKRKKIPPSRRYLIYPTSIFMICYQLA